MNSARHFARHIFVNLERRHNAMLIFHVFFSVLATVILIPATSRIMTVMLTRSGERAISNREVIEFMLSPAGLLWALAGGTLVLCLVTFQRAGLIVIAAADGGGPYRQAVTALVHVARRLPRLFKLALIQVAAHLLLALPFLLILFGLHETLLAGHENAMREKSPAFWLFLVAALPFVLAITVINGSLYVRWLLALPCVMLEHLRVRAALRRSHRLTRGWRLRLALKAGAVALMILLLPVILVYVFDNVATLALGALPDQFALLIPATLLVLALYFLFAFILSFLGIGIGALFVFVAYRRATGRVNAPLPAKQSRRAGLFSWSMEILLVLFSIGQAAQVLDRFRFVDNVTIIAHRGSSIEAPENTIAAVELAIRQGADYVEVDVRESADGTLVLFHDHDLRRIAERPGRIAELTREELARIDVGSRVGEAYAGERIPTLAEAIETVRSRAGLFVDVKIDPEATNTLQTLVEVLRARNVLDGAVIAAAQPHVLRATQALAPETRTALLVHFSIGSLAAQEFEILALRPSAVTPEFILRAHRNGHEVHVFTVNGRAEMSRLIDMGVDGIITDRPAVLRDLLAERAALSRGELLVVKLRHWLQR